MTVGRIISSLLSGAFVGASIFVVYVWFVPKVNEGIVNVIHFGFIFGMGLPVFLLAFVFWLIGLLIFAVPSWLLMQKLGKTTWAHAAFLGLALAFLVDLGFSTRGFQMLPIDGSSPFFVDDRDGTTWINNRLTHHGWMKALDASLKFSMSAVPVALTIWWKAYRPVK